MEKKEKDYLIDGPKLKFYREKRNCLTQEELAGRVGIDVKTIRRYEIGHSRGSLKFIRYIAEALEVKPENLIYRKADGSPTDNFSKYQIVNKVENYTGYVIFGSMMRIGRLHPGNPVDIPVCTKKSILDVSISRLQTEIYFEDRYFRLRCVGSKNPDLILQSPRKIIQVPPGKTVALTTELSINIAGTVKLKYNEYFLPVNHIPSIIAGKIINFSSTVSAGTLKNRADVEDIPVCCSLYDDISNRNYVLSRNVITFGDKSCCIQSNKLSKAKIDGVLVCIDRQLFLCRNSGDYIEIELGQKINIGDNEFVINDW